MKSKSKYNTRTCLLTRKVYPKQELIRFCVINNQIVCDNNHKLLGRGYYVYPQQDLYQKMVKAHLWERILRREVSVQEYESLKAMLEE